MLAERVELELYGKQTDSGISVAVVKNGSLSGKSVYFISRKPIEKKKIDAIITAVAYDSSGNVIREIAAAKEDVIVYEPELAKRLENIKGFKYSKLQCLYEKSCGAVVFNRMHREPVVLLVKNKNGRYWSFPKGHIEYGESEEDTALREIKEETGLSVKTIRGFREISDYCPFGKIKKRVVFFLAEADNSEVFLQEEEIDSSVWVTFKQARSMCSYRNDINVLKKAERIVYKIRSDSRKSKGFIRRYRNERYN